MNDYKANIFTENYHWFKGFPKNDLPPLLPGAYPRGDGEVGDRPPLGPNIEKKIHGKNT